MRFIENFPSRSVRVLMFGIGLFILAVSCEDAIEVDQPNSQLTGETVFEDENTARAALNDIYAKIRDQSPVSGNSTGVSVLMGEYADGFTFYGSSELAEADFYNHSVIPTNSTVASLWDQSYSIIYASNALLEGIENASKIDVEYSNALKGEGLFIRAYMHFYLVNLFGKVPYITTTDYDQNKNVVRLSVKEVYNNIENDLIEAKALLTTEDASGEKLFPNYWAADALLAKVYLFQENWNAAAAQASEIIGSGVFPLEESLDTVFLKEASSTIWQLDPGSNGLNAIEGRTFIFETAPPPAGAISEHLLNSFEPDDQRKMHWLGSVAGEQETYYFPYKYKQKTNTGVSQEYSILFRIAEQYLIRSEARAHLGDFGGAVADLNKIRNRAGLPNTEAITEATLLNELVNEWQAEFFAEQGNRWFDLKRTGRADEVLQNQTGWKASDTLLPIPQKEFMLNQNLGSQNPGY